MSPFLLKSFLKLFGWIRDNNNRLVGSKILGPKSDYMTFFFMWYQHKGDRSVSLSLSLISLSVFLLGILNPLQFLLDTNTLSCSLSHVYSYSFSLSRSILFIICMVHGHPLYSFLSFLCSLYLSCSFFLFSLKLSMTIMSIFYNFPVHQWLPSSLFSIPAS